MSEKIYLQDMKTTLGSIAFLSILFGLLLIIGSVTYKVKNNNEKEKYYKKIALIIGIVLSILFVIFLFAYIVYSKKYTNLTT